MGEKYLNKTIYSLNAEFSSKVQNDCKCAIKNANISNVKEQ